MEGITIGLSVYNAEEFIDDCIKSIILQSYKNWELIIIDDGSTDGSLSRVLKYDDARISVFHDGQNKGLATRLNEIAERAKFSFIARMDADDLMMPNRLEVLLSFLKRNKKYDLVSSGMISIDYLNRYKGSRGERVDFYTLDSFVSKKVRFAHAPMLVRTEWLRRNRYNENVMIAQDYELWLRCLVAKDFRAASIPDRLYVYREDQNIKKAKLIKTYQTGIKFASKNIDSYFERLKFFFFSWVKIYLVKITPKVFLYSLLSRRRNRSYKDKYDELRLKKLLKDLYDYGK
ncbi:MAG: glycosyltransferase [Idiomarinaceae bacterium]|nr:glycosyltransferase [Idiomarinaceae bacterium]